MNVCLTCGRVYGESLERCPTEGADLLPYDPSLAPGDHVAGCRIVTALGVGHCGEVYEATEKVSGDRVVLRLLAEELTPDERTAETLRRQLLKTQDFGHFGVASVHNVELHVERLVLVRDWVEGERIQDVLDRQGAFPLPRALDVALQVCQTMSEVHTAGVLHLQLRASNVFIASGPGNADQIKLVDFNIGPLRHVGTRAVFGTLRSMSPEQIEGKVVSVKSDIFSAGLLLYRLIVGSSAYSGTEAQVTRRVVEDPLPTLCTPQGDAVPAEITGLVRHMTEKRPMARPASFGQVVERLLQLRATVSSTAAGAKEPAAPARPKREAHTIMMMRPASLPAEEPVEAARGPAAAIGARRDQSTKLLFAVTSAHKDAAPAAGVGAHPVVVRSAEPPKEPVKESIPARLAARLNSAAVLREPSTGLRQAVTSRRGPGRHAMLPPPDAVPEGEEEDGPTVTDLSAESLLLRARESVIATGRAKRPSHMALGSAAPPAGAPAAERTPDANASDAPSDGLASPEDVRVRMLERLLAQARVEASASPPRATPVSGIEVLPPVSDKATPVIPLSSPLAAGKILAAEISAEKPDTAAKPLPAPAKPAPHPAPAPAPGPDPSRAAASLKSAHGALGAAPTMMAFDASAAPAPAPIPASAMPAPGARSAVRTLLGSSAAPTAAAPAPAPAPPAPKPAASPAARPADIAAPAGPQVARPGAAAVSAFGMEALPEGVAGVRRSVRPPPLPVSRLSEAPIDRDEVDGFPFGSLAGAMSRPASRWKLVAIVVGGAVVLGASVGAVAYFLSGTGRSATAPAGNRPATATAGGPDVSVVALGPGVVAASREAGALPGADARATSDASDPEASAAAQDAVAGPESAAPSNGPDAPAESAPEAIADAGPLPEAGAPGEPAAADVGAVEPAVDAAVVAVEPPENGDEEDTGPSVWRLVGLADRAMAQRDFDKARQLYQDVLDIRPGFRRARAGIGKVAFQESEFEEACRYLEPLYADRGNMMLGVIYTRLGRLQDAKRQFERVLRRTPNSVEAQRALEAVNRQLGTP